MRVVASRFNLSTIGTSFGSFTGTVPSYEFLFVFRLPTAVFFLVLFGFWEIDCGISFLFSSSFFFLQLFVHGRVESVAIDDDGNPEGRPIASAALYALIFKFRMLGKDFSDNTFG